MLTSEGFRPGLCPAGCIRELATHHPSFCSSFHQAGALVPEADAQTCWVRSGGRSRGPQTYHHHRATTNPRGDGQGAPTLGPEDQTLPRPDLGSEPLSAKAGRQENTKTAQKGALRVWVSGNGASSSPRATLQGRNYKSLFTEETDSEESSNFPNVSGQRLQSNLFLTLVSFPTFHVCFCRIS